MSPVPEKELDKLIQFYIETSEVYSFEMALKKMSDATTNDNYNYIVDKIDNHPQSSELDLSMYLYEIASPVYSDLEMIIRKKLQTFQDHDAIEDLEGSLVRIVGKNERETAESKGRSTH